jgi:hypothetical protein
VAGITHRSYSDPPQAFSPSFSPLCPWIHGPFPAIKFAVAPSSPLPISGDPGSTVARACLNSGDLTAVERSSAARSHRFPRSDFPHPILIERLGPPRTPPPPPSDLDRMTQTPSDPCSCPLPPGAGPTRSARSSPLSLTPPGPLVSARPPARAPSAADIISAVGF